jgi:hypothetical protein
VTRAPYFESNSVLSPKLSEEKKKLFMRINGCLLEVTKTRPDIVYYVSVLMGNNQNPSEIDWNNMRNLLRYLKYSREKGIIFNRRNDGEIKVMGYTDADWAGDTLTCKSRNGYVFSINDGPIIYSSRKQTVVARSSNEAEYIGMSDACQSVMGIILMLEEIGFNVGPIRLLEDNKSAIALAEGSTIGKRSRHIEIHRHYVRDCVEKRRVVLEHCPTKEMVADIFTKSLERVLFERHSSKLVG